MLNEQIIQILWLAITTIAIIIFYTSIKLIITCINNKILTERDIKIYNIKYNEEEILGHLDYIINESLENYIAINLVPKNIYYITNQMENDITNKLIDTISDKISPTLYSKLTLIYDPGVVGTIIGQRIYTAVLEYVISFNIQNENKGKIKNK